MTPSELVFIGIKGSVVALNRATGSQVWATHLKGYDFVNVVVEDSKVFASCHGEVFCLDPLTGDALWHNRLKGLGTGLVTIATAGMGSSRLATLMAEKRRCDEAAATAATTTVA